MTAMKRPSCFEDDYFAREDIEKKRRLAFERSKEMEKKERDALRQLHFMKCPKCGMDLQTLVRGSVEIDTCFGCGGVWLDVGELEQIIAYDRPKEHGLSHALLAILKGG
jgi:hypothetical protein